MIFHKKGELVYNSIIDKQLCRLIEMNLDLKDLLYNTEILVIDVMNDSYPQLHFLTD